MERGHEILIQKVMGIMRDNLSEPLSVVDLAKKVGYSPSHLRLIFRKATGKGILPHLLDLRMERAKRLLRDTKLTIGEITFESGYTSYKCFGAAFKTKVGCSPGSFRRSQGITVRSTQPGRAKKMQEQSPNENPDDWSSGSFDPLTGEWKQQDDTLIGRSSGVACVFFREPVPENFRLRFQARLFSQAGLLSNEIGIGLDRSKTQFSHAPNTYYGFVLGRMDSTFGEFRMAGVPLLFNSKAVLKRDTWHDIEIELQEDTISLALDGAELFRHRDPFPPPFARRSNLVFATTNGMIGFRKFEMLNKGLPPFVKSVRQGDSIYNAGFFSSARDFYLRLLASKVSNVDAMELRYKIGQCFFREEDYPQARGWMERVIETPQTGFWADHAKLAELEMDIREKQLSGLEQSLKSLFEKANYRQRIRQMMNEACVDLAMRGFYEKALVLRTLLSQCEESDSYPYLVSQIEIAEILLQMRHFEESQKQFTSIIGNLRTPKTMRMYVLFSYCNNVGMQGKRSEWEKVLTELEAFAAPSPADTCRLSTLRGIYHRAGGEWEKALAELSLAYEQRGTIAQWPFYSRYLRALLLCSLGRISEARESMKEAMATEPTHPWLAMGRRSAMVYPVELSDGNYETAAECLKEDSNHNGGTANGAEQATKAGILMVLAGKQDEATAIWKRAANLFPENRVSFWGPFAESLAAGKMDSADAMPYPAEKRSEMFYLLGLLCEFKADLQRAHAFFKKSVVEDPLLNWPAVMARKKVATFPP